MGYVPSTYWVRVKVNQGQSGEDTYLAALTLASTLAQEHPGLHFEVEEDKVWASFLTDDTGR